MKSFLVRGEVLFTPSITIQAESEEEAIKEFKQFLIDLNGFEYNDFTFDFATDGINDETIEADEFENDDSEEDEDE